MRTAAVAFVSSGLFSAVLTPIAREAAHRWGVLDHALTSRKIHGKPIPRLGGIAIVIAFYLPLAALFFVNTEVGARLYSQPSRAAGLFLGGLIIAGLGVWDDLRGANAKTKFAVQFAVAALMYAIGFRIDCIANPFGASIELGWFGLPFTLLWIAGIVNAMNLIDGLDGLAGGVAFIAVATILVIAGVHDRPLMVLFAAALAGAVLGFLIYNFNPATIFMGDTGSMFLGFVLATTSIQTGEKSSTAVAIAVPILALGVPIADTLLAMMRRYARGAPMFSADREHIHHRLLGMGLSQRQTVLVIYAACTVLGGIALVLSFASSKVAATALAVVGGATYLALRRLGFIDLDRTREILEQRKRNLALRGSVRQAGAALQEAGSLEEVWVATREASKALGASAVALSIDTADGERRSFAVGFGDAAGAMFRARYGLVMERPDDDTLELGWLDGRSQVDRDTEIAVELLCDHLSTAVERILRDQETPLREVATG